MRRAMKLAAAAALTFPSLLLPGPLPAAETRCAAAAEGHLRDLGVPASDVTRLLHLEQYQFVFDQETVVGYEAWADLKSCPRGQLVLVMGRACSLRTFFTTGGCPVPRQAS